MQISIEELNELLQKEFERGRNSIPKQTTVDWSQVWSKGTSTNYIPKACINCSQHPSNGGSGICSCVLPDEIIY